jgi:UDP-2,4-diacetamido-2,4,6-trideoxy-beta-L-altropyranose hydrolase
LKNQNEVPHMKHPTLLIRADANGSIGTGHVMRCAALAEAWQEAGGTAVFLASEMPSRLESRLSSRGMRVVRMDATPGRGEDASLTLAQAREHAAEWIVVDGDQFGVDFLRSMRAAGLWLLLLDDFADRESFPVDLLVNPNLGADAGIYAARSGGTCVLTGPRYALLRGEFRRATTKAFDGGGNKVLVTLGGSDPENLAPRIAAALAGRGRFKVTLVAGPGYAGASELEKISGANCTIVVDPESMAELMANADLAVIAAGGTLWELLASGCVALSYSRNPVQSRVVELLAHDGVVVDMGATSLFDPARLISEASRLASAKVIREEMATRGRKLVDGAGAARVVEAMQQVEASR